MSILVTGGCGFIGSNFVQYALDNCDESIVVLDNLTYAGRIDNLPQQNPRVLFFRGDIADETTVKNVFDTNDISMVFNFAAETHVDRSISKSEDFIRSNIVGVQVLIEQSRKSKNFKRFVQVSCYDDRTLALTKNGIKRYDEIVEGDVVYSLNPHTKELEEKPVQKVIVQDYDGDMVRFQTSRLDLMVTPNHRMFIENTRGDIVVEEAIKTKERSVFRMPKAHWIGKTTTQKNMSDVLYLLGIFIGDGWAQSKVVHRVSKTGLSKPEYLLRGRDASGRFVRLGCVGDKPVTCTGHRIYLDIPEKDPCRKRVEETLSRMGIKWHAEKAKAGEHIYFSSEFWVGFFNENAGRKAPSKDIPKWALSLPPEQLRYLFDGLMDSDGTKDRKSYTTSSIALVRSFCELCLKLGFHVRYQKISGRPIFPRRTHYVVYPSIRKRKTATKRNCSLVAYKGKIWCLKVKDNKNFAVVRNGRIDFCGNTDEVYGSLDSEESPFTEQNKICPSSPYSASKASADLLLYSYFKTHGFPVVITRCSNNYGPRQHIEKFLPKVITNALQNKSIPVYGKGSNVRDWIFVEDHCEGVWLAGERGEPGEVYNLGGNCEMCNIEIAQLILDLMGKPKSLIDFVEDRKGHDFRYAINYTKATRKLGWIPWTDFMDGLRRTILWYKKNDGWTRNCQ